MGRANRRSNHAGDPREASSARVERLVQDEVDSSVSLLIDPNEIKEIIAWIDPSGTETVLSSLQEAFDRGEAFCCKEDSGEISGVAGLLLEPSRDSGAALDSAISRNLRPTEASLPLLHAKSAEQRKNLILRAEETARAHGKKKMLLHGGTPENPSQAKDLLEEGYSFLGVESRGSTAGKLVFCKDLLDPLSPGETFQLEEAQRMSGSGWKQGHYNPLSIELLPDADRKKPLTLSYEEKNVLEETDQLKDENLLGAFQEVVLQNRQLLQIDRSTKGGKKLVVWTFAPSGGTGSRKFNQEEDTLTADIFSAEPPEEILSHPDQVDLKMLYYESAQGAEDLEMAREDLFRARRKAERDLVQKGTYPNQEIIDNSQDVLRAKGRLLASLRETENQWNFYSEEVMRRASPLRLQGKKREESAVRMQQISEHLESFKSYYS